MHLYLKNSLFIFNVFKVAWQPNSKTLLKFTRLRRCTQPAWSSALGTILRSALPFPQDLLSARAPPACLGGLPCPYVNKKNRFLSYQSYRFLFFFSRHWSTDTNTHILSRQAWNPCSSSLPWWACKIIHMSRWWMTKCSQFSPVNDTCFNLTPTIRAVENINLCILKRLYRYFSWTEDMLWSRGVSWNNLYSYLGDQQDQLDLEVRRRSEEQGELHGLGSPLGKKKKNEIDKDNGDWLWQSRKRLEHVLMNY